MKSWGLTENDTDKIYNMGGGGFYLRTDAKLIFDTFAENQIEMDAAIRNDVDGSGFIKDMFCYELANHEYCITYDLEPTLDACGLTEDEVIASHALLNGLKLAKQQSTEYILRMVLELIDKCKTLEELREAVKNVLDEAK